MADGVFLCVSHLGKRSVVAFGLEDGIIAETLCAASLVKDVARADAFEEIFLSFICSRNNGAKSCAAIGFIF